MDSMSATIMILLAGMAVVIGSILGFRLHAFLALVLGALTVALLTPAASVEQYALKKDRLELHAISKDGREAVLIRGKRAVRAGTVLVLLRLDEKTGTLTEIAELEVSETLNVEDEAGKKQNQLAVLLHADDPSLVMRADDVVVEPATQAAAAALAYKTTIGKRLVDGFGSTCAKVGILIAMASIIGTCLLESGAADRIVRSALKLFGEKGAPFAFLGSGFTLGIPVFFDTVFYLMIPLGKALRMRTGRNYLLYVLTIVAGGTMAHSLVPPTPGPLFVAEAIGVDLGTMILAGCVVGFFTSGAGCLFALVMNRFNELPLRGSAELSLEDLEAIAHRDESELPPLGLSLLPVILPVVLIAGYTILKRFTAVPADGVAATLGDKNVALLISAAIAMGTLIWHKRTTRSELAKSMQSALASGGVIILITAAGGAFGQILQQTGVSDLIQNQGFTSRAGLITFAFLVTTAIRTAQGSATVAMITAVGVLAGVSTEALGFHPVYLALAIGCGSKPIAWMNDSGFWVIGKMSGMTEAETLRYITPMSCIMGGVGLAVVIAGATLFPMAG